MGPSSTNLSLSALMLVAGIGIPVMAALNGGLGARLGNPWAASFILMLAGTAIAGVALGIAGWPNEWFTAAPHYYAGGLLVAFYVLSITWAAPRIGVANAIFFVLVGQIVSAGLIDQFGWFGAIRSPITIERGIGIALMLAGVFLARRIA